jgi:hypothetical protein
MSKAKPNGNNQAHAGMGADEDIHHDNGKPRAKTTWRMRVLPKTLQTNPVTVATSQGQGVCSDVLSRSV